jgi:hypothetical protein
MTGRTNRITDAARTTNPICLIVPAVIATVVASTITAVHTGWGAVVVAQLTTMGTTVANLF